MEVPKLPSRPTLFKFDPQILYQTQVWSLPCLVSSWVPHSLLLLKSRNLSKSHAPSLCVILLISFKELIWFRKPMQCLSSRQSCRQLVKFVKLICYSCNMDLLKLLHGFVQIVICISLPIPTKSSWSLSKILNIVDWLRAVNRVDRLTALDPDVRCAFGNVYISD